MRKPTLPEVKSLNCERVAMVVVLRVAKLRATSRMVREIRPIRVTMITCCPNGLEGVGFAVTFVGVDTAGAGVEGVEGVVELSVAAVMIAVEEGVDWNPIEMGREDAWDMSSSSSSSFFWLAPMVPPLMKYPKIPLVVVRRAESREDASS